MTITITTLWHYAVSRFIYFYAESLYAECRGAITTINITTFSIMTHSTMTLSATAFSIMTLSVTRRRQRPVNVLSVNLLNVVAPTTAPSGIKLFSTVIKTYV